MEDSSLNCGFLAREHMPPHQKVTQINEAMARFRSLAKRRVDSFDATSRFSCLDGKSSKGIGCRQTLRVNS